MSVQAYNVNAAELRRTALLVAAVMPTLKWRAHGIGLLQAWSVNEDTVQWCVREAVTALRTKYTTEDYT